MKISRRKFLKQGAAALGAAAAAPALSRVPAWAAGEAPHIRSKKIAQKVITIGYDGMDPNLLKRFIGEGRMPNFKKLIAMGHFGELQTTMPPQSPVAWSSFITGTNPGGNGIFDFVHRDPKSFTPYMSTSRSFDSKDTVKMGEWLIPLKSGKVELMRKGRAFWSILEERDIPSWLFQIPANFPVTTDKVKAISGMGTPDLLGTYGTFTLFSETEFPGSKDFVGGRVVQVSGPGHTFKTKLPGPKNSFKTGKKTAEMDLTINRDPTERMVKITTEYHDLILKEGEWSEWIPVTFKMVPMFVSVGGMVRFYVKEVHPHLKIYCSPINVDPLEPSLPICSPASYSKELSEAVGRFYTQGFPADSKGLSTGVLTNEEYLQQAHIVLDECMRALDWQLAQFNEGFFFFYFSSIDQNSHMMWRCMDPKHPLYDPKASDAAKNAIRGFYERMDYSLGRVLEKVDNYTTLFALSDHGFAPFTREFNLNTWLYQNGYLKLTDDSKFGEGEFYRYVDWENTKAYGLGINGLFMNLDGRELHGSLDPVEAKKVKAEIIAKLETVTDPKNGQKVLTRAYDGTEIYSGGFTALAPDIVCGYRSGYRVSDESVLGKFPKDVVCDRTDKWAADHCSDPAVVPGILVSNKKWQHPRPALLDMAPTILGEFGLSPTAEMEGKNIFSS